MGLFGLSAKLLSSSASSARSIVNENGMEINDQASSAYGKKGCPNVNPGGSNDTSTFIRYQEAEMYYQKLYNANLQLSNDNKRLSYDNQQLFNYNQHLYNYIQRFPNDYQQLSHYNQKLITDSQRQKSKIKELQNQIDLELKKKQDLAEQLQDANTNLEQKNENLERRYKKKDEDYKKLNKNYMDLVRPLQVSGIDHSTIFNRLMHVRGSIESLIQTAKGDRSVNLINEAAIEHFRDSGLLESFPIDVADLEVYHLNLYMESAVMSTLINCIFKRPLECVFEHSERFDDISSWVGKRDPMISTRWRQQICALVAQDTEAMGCKREAEVNKTGIALFSLVSRVYSNVDMSLKIKELCYNAFDLSFVMFRMESRIYPDPLPLGTPFDDKNMETPQKSNPTGTVSLVIFPAFRDSNNAFNIKPKVWCA
ncbi:hypothetical protein EDD11_001959 [Mortierella claussenii]|nr:hypothetical protein EDD11_001959 [Mortierella claussenii]